MELFVKTRATLIQSTEREDARQSREKILGTGTMCVRGMLCGNWSRYFDWQAAESSRRVLETLYATIAGSTSTIGLTSRHTDMI